MLLVNSEYEYARWIVNTSFRQTFFIHSLTIKKQCQ